MTIKRLSEKDAPKIKELLHYCFYFISTPDSFEVQEDFLSSYNLEDNLGYFINDELVSTYFIHSYRFFVRGVLMDMGGIGAVTTQPEFRRQGLVKKLALESFKVMRNNKQFLSVLYPFKFSYYRRFGYDNCAEIYSVSSPPGNILLPKDFIPLEFRRVSKKEMFKLSTEIRKKYGSKYNLVIFNSLKSFESHLHSKKYDYFVIFQEKEPIGYFICRQEKREGDWNVRLKIVEHLMGSTKARLTMFDYIKKHTDQNKDFKIWFYGDENITDYFDDLWEGTFVYEITGGPMFRVIDIAEALKLLEFPADLETFFTLKVSDEMAPWNEEPLIVTIKNGKASVKKFTGKNIDLETDIKAFTQLFVGYRSIYDLKEVLKVKVKTNMLDLFDSIFPKRHTRITTGF